MGIAGVEPRHNYLIMYYVSAKRSHKDPTLNSKINPNPLSTKKNMTGHYPFAGFKRAWSK
jgi:hypothetical protein